LLVYIYIYIYYFLLYCYHDLVKKIKIYNDTRYTYCTYSYVPRPRGTFWNSAICLSVPWRSCLGHRHAGCLQLSHRRPPEMCGLRTRPRTDVDPPRFFPPSNWHQRGAYSFAAPGAMLCLSQNWAVHPVTSSRTFLLTCQLSPRDRATLRRRVITDVRCRSV